MTGNIFIAFSIGLIVLSHINDVHAQRAVVFPQRLDKFTVLDTALITITYEVEIVDDTAKFSDKQKDIQILQIGKHISKSYSKLLFEADSINTAAIKSGAVSAPLFQGVIPPIEVFKNYPDNKLTVTYRTFAQGPIYLYVEDKIHFNWKILTERKKILNYTCQKATTTFRGRNYEAWFTSDIPKSEGPYKFDGLPGLILQIQDDKQYYKFNCIGILQNKKQVPIKLWSWQYQQTTRDKLNPLLIRIFDRPVDFIESIGIRIYIKDKTKKFSFPYNPIELE